MLISIITINHNNLQGLIRTMKSVLEQTYSDIEYIVIDGRSSDGSKAYIESNQDQLSYWVSEPDRGIYHAMNKGIDQATGGYLLFLNSGDCFNSPDALKKLIAHKPEEDIVYGNSLFIYPDKETQLKIMPSNLKGMTIFYRTLNHQAVFHNRRIFENGKRYNEEYKMLADWVLYNEVILFENGTYRHIDLVIANYDANGFSSEQENNAIMQSERNKFYAANIDFFIPYFIRNYEDLKGKLRKPKLSDGNRYYNAYVLFKKAIRMVVKGN